MYLGPCVYRRELASQLCAYIHIHGASHLCQDVSLTRNSIHPTTSSSVSKVLSRQLEEEGGGSKQALSQGLRCP